jgi:NAD(P)H-dependent FMN reductase
VAKPVLRIIIGSTRPGRVGPSVAAWITERAIEHDGFDVQVTDLAELNLPILDEPNHPRLRQYTRQHTKDWSAVVDAADAFVFVTPEYDHGPPAALINALQYLVKEWTYKPVGFVSYGGVSAGTRGVQITKEICTSLKMMPMFETVAIPFFAQHIDAKSGVFDPGEVQTKALGVMLDELLRWANALAPLRGSNA